MADSSKMKKNAARVAFVLAGLLILAMAGATVLEKCCGSEFAFRYVYHSPIFIALWAAMAVLGLVSVVSRHTLSTKTATVLIHISFCVILLGALLSHVTSSDGAMHLREGERASVFETRDGGSVQLPFSIELNSFEISYYMGTSAARDYCSHISIEALDAQSQSFDVSMNKICRFGGYRFYQASYDEDEGGSTLAVSHDPYGVPLTYAGYILLLISLIMFFFQRDSGFRVALRKLSGKKCSSSESQGNADGLQNTVCDKGSDNACHGAMCMIAILLMFSMFQPCADASSQNSLPKTVPQEVAEAFGDMYVYYGGRVCPMNTLSRDVTMKLYGHQTYKGLSADQVLAGWVFFPSDWSRKTTSDMKKDRSDLVSVLNSGSLLKIFPERDSLSNSGQVQWYAAVDDLPFNIPSDRWFFIRKVLSLAGEDATLGQWDEAQSIFLKLKDYQVKYAGADMLPSAARVRAERLYNSIGLPKLPAMICLTAGLLLFILSAAGCERKWLKITAFALSVCVLVYLTLVLALRWYISSHVPMSNGFEVMMLMAWILMLFTSTAAKRFPLVLPFGLLIGGFALLVASIGESDPQITSLMPVLSSPLLSIHVASMMISYSLFGILMMNSMLALIRGWRDPAVLENMRHASIVILCPAVFLLTAGTFLGAVWANVSWGTYWGWDPKEVWALISILIYAIPLHSSVLKAFRSDRFFHWYCALSFICIIVTYFGVNFFLGGMHSYA